MSIQRRTVVKWLTCGVLTGIAGPTLLMAEEKRRPIRAIAFDAFPIFDPRPLAELTENQFPGQGQALLNAWRTRQFEYQWLTALGEHYQDFWSATESGLQFAAKGLHLELSEEKRRTLMNAYLNLNAWPDVASGLEKLKAAGLKLTFLSNMTREMLLKNARHAGVESYFDHVISTDDAKTFKPAPRAYQLGEKTLGIAREEILFVAFAGWDVAGSKWFGYPTYWLNRVNAPAEHLGVQPDATGRDMNELVKFVLGA